MITKETIEWIGVTIFIGGIVVWMISHQIVINHTQKNLKPICRDLYGDENYYTGKLDMYEIMYIEGLAVALFLIYYFVYKKLNRFTIFKKYENNDVIFPNLSPKKALVVIEKHYKWLVLCTVSIFLSFLWILGTGLCMWLAKNLA